MSEWSDSDMNEAYQKGRADMRKEMMSGEPDGYCAWHPEKGTRIYQTVYSSWMDAALFAAESSEGRKAIQEAAIQGLNVLAAVLAERGWQIIPVKLIHIEASGDE